MAADHGREIAARRRKERLEAALRANLKQRKAQQRARRAKTGTASDAPENSGTSKIDAAGAKRD